jgi:hypothetical protein
MINTCRLGWCMVLEPVPFGRDGWALSLYYVLVFGVFLSL